jgi:hypothetical protein
MACVAAPDRREQHGTDQHDMIMPTPTPMKLMFPAREFP